MKSFIDMWEHAFNFNGRISKREFWQAYRLGLFIYIIFIGISLVIIQGNNEVVGGIMACIAISCIFMLVIPMLSLQLRRFHDVGYSLTSLIFCIIFTPLGIGFLIKLLILKKDSAADNKWGLQSKNDDLMNTGDKTAYMTQPAYFVDCRITEEQLPQKKKWEKNMFLLFLISLISTILIMVILFQIL